jgi:hypothetical protein
MLQSPHFLRRTLLFIYSIALSTSIGAQADSTRAFTFSGYVETYWSYDLSDPASNTRPPFFYSYHRHNEFTANMAYLKANYNANSARANVALMAGTYASANLSAEPDVLKNILEANVGIRLSKKHQIWLDGGILPSHIGFESAIGRDCNTLSRSLIAENSPYYESGARLSYTSGNGKWYAALLGLNGWQQIARPSGRSQIGGGWQLTLKPASTITLNSSAYLGPKPGTAEDFRFFHNFYGIFQLSNQFSLTLGFDVGKDRPADARAAEANWYGLSTIARYALSNRTSVSARYERYNDLNGAIISGTYSPFQVNGYSFNVDILATDHAVFRMEYRLLQSEKEFFRDRKGKSTPYNSAITVAMAAGF